MAAAEGAPRGAAAAARDSLRRWRWMLALMAVALLLRALLPPFAALQSPLDMLGTRDWVPAGGIALQPAADGLGWQAGAQVPAFATRPLAVDPGALFVAVTLCRGAAADAATPAALMLASLRGGAPDFNRKYVFWELGALREGDCASTSFPRLPGDGPALLQLQLRTPQQHVVLQRLEVVPLAEDPRWRALRLPLLLLGVVLLVRLFAFYAGAGRGWRGWAGLLVVVVILFGCLVDVQMKAAIHQLLSGAPQAAGPAQGEVLRSAFPIAGFALFSGGHVGLFALAGLLLAGCGARAWIDLALLAPATEVLQVLVPGRGPGVEGVLLDSAGLAAAALLVLAVSAYRKRLLAK